MIENRLELKVGTEVMTQHGPWVVTYLDRSGVGLEDGAGNVEHVTWPDLGIIQPQEPDPKAEGAPALRSFAAEWNRLDDVAREEAMFRLGVVLEILTGFWHGHPSLALPGEPYDVFDLAREVKLTARCEHMAKLLRHGAFSDRAGGRDLSKIAGRTVQMWASAFQTLGVIGLVDGRRSKTVTLFSTLPAAWVQAAHTVVEELDGDPSTVNHREIERRVKVRLKDDGLEVIAPERAVSTYISHLMRIQGRTTRQQRSNTIRKVSGTESYPGLLPGQLVAIDVTRADVLVWCPDRRGACSVEIITAIDVATRMVLALRVVPMSADAHDASLLMYDVMRPFSQLVEGTTVNDWAWAGVPEKIQFYFDDAAADPDCSGVEVGCPRSCRSVRVAPGLQGEHTVPGVRPSSVRADHGSIFISQVFRAQLARIGCDLAYSRTRRPIDNGIMERFHETLQRGLQQLPGYKGRNTAERGRKVGTSGAHKDEPLLTPVELQQFLRRWVALDYHRTPHAGLHVAGAEYVDLRPVDMFDAVLRVTGRLHVPQRPDMLYDFLPVRWGTVGPAGVEFADLTYDSPDLAGLRNAPIGRFRPEDRAMPFMYDPHDVTRVWFRDPDTDRIVEVPWRKAHLTEAPLTEALAQHVRAAIRQRDDGKRMSRKVAEDEIIAELGSLLDGVIPKEWRKRISQARQRYESSRRDHTEAEVAMTVANLVNDKGASAPSRRTDTSRSIWDDSWAFPPRTTVDEVI